MEHTVLHFLEDACKRSGDSIALLDEKRSFTYQELRKNALKVGNSICKWNEKKQAVVVLSERDIRCIAMFWGVLYSGNFYVPINYKTNKGIFFELIKETHIVGILCCEDNKEIEEICKKLKIKYSYFEQMVSGESVNDIQDIRILENDPAYMVFTSGSTGIPKGIVKSHHSIVSFVKSFQKEFQFQKDDVFGNQAEFDYDVAAKDIYMSASVGAKLSIIPKKCFLMPVKLMQYIEKWEINTLIWAAAAVRLVANSGCLEKYHHNLKIKKVFFSGEELARETVEEWVRFLPDVQYVNLYAPSEVTGNCLYYKIDITNIPHKLPLGIPFDNVEILLFNDNLKLAGENEQGEICVRGSFVSLGYYCDMIQTKEKFIQNPLHNNYIDLIYKTGDMAKYVNGELYFLGRKDYQIKFMGHRIELFEIEEVFIQASGAKQCCCVFEDSSLILFYLGPLEIDKAINNMKDILPKYKIPQKFIELTEFPENARGKVDRRKIISKYKEWQDERGNIDNFKGN